MKRAFIKDRYGEVIQELEPSEIIEDGWVIPNGDDPFPCFFEDGDTFTVVVEED